MTVEIYVTNSEVLYPRKDNDLDEAVIRLYGRTRDHEEETITVYGQESYFYIPADEAEKVNPVENDKLARYEETDIIPLEDRFKPPSQQRTLTKVVAEDPYYNTIKGLRSLWDQTWGADVRYTNRLRIDRGIKTGVRAPSRECRAQDLEAVEITDVEPRVCYFDIETDDRATGFPEPGEARILSIAAYDSYDQDLTVFIETDGQSIEEFFDIETPETLADFGVTEPDELNVYEDEREMLFKFAEWLTDCNPDIITGWNSGDDANDGFDLPHLIERMDHAGVNPSRLSREGFVECKDIGDDEWRVRVRGRTVYDLMDGWVGTKFTKPDSKKLDNVAASALDDAKIEHPNMGYYEMWEKDPQKFVDYNAKDTRLAVEINDAENVFGFKKRLRDMIGVDWEETRENNEFVAMSVRRKCREHGVSMITAWDNPHVRAAAESQDDDGVNYEGAFVFPAFRGLKRNVVGKDLASLYPMTQAMLNASPDTKIDRKTAFKEGIPHVVAANGTCFRTDVASIIKELVDEYDELKMEFKRRKRRVEYGTAEYDALDGAYNTTKTIYNSYYGYTGWDKSPLYDPDIAAAVTLTGQRVIKRTAEYIEEETVATVVYGDTDSNYVQYPEEMDQREVLEYATEVCETLSSEVYSDLCQEFNIDPAENRWEIELEMLADRFFMSGQKKFYAYRAMWNEGMDFDEQVNDGEGKITIKGYACVKSNFSTLTKETQREVLYTILEDGSKQDVAEIMFEAASSIDPASPDWNALGMPQGIGQKINPEKAGQDDYYAWSPNGNHPQSAHPRGVWFANHLLDVKYAKGDQPKRIYLKPNLTVNGEPVDVIAYEDARDLEPIEDELRIDAAQMQEKLLEKPMADILDSFDMEMDDALMGRATTQAGLGAWS